MSYKNPLSTKQKVDFLLGLLSSFALPLSFNLGPGHEFIFAEVFIKRRRKDREVYTLISPMSPWQTKIIVSFWMQFSYLMNANLKFV